MITELAKLIVSQETCEAFEAAVAEAAPLFKRAKGCRSLELRPITEIKGGYMLVVGWETLDNHMVDFRESEDFQAWRSLVGHFFIQPPEVIHLENGKALF